MANVALRNVTKVFPGGTVALDDVSLDVADGELVVLLGPSGCGKSTLLRIVAGLEDPTAGSVLLDGEPADELPPWERGVAMVFQHYALYPHMSVGDNIGFPLKVSGLEPVPRRQRTEDAASALGIADLLDRRTTHLSGGQRQRVAMGRAIIRDPRLFLLDEPLSNLDSGLRAELRTEISALSRQLGATSIYVTHDQSEALTMADRLAILSAGTVQDVGTPTEVYNRPATAYVATFLGNPRMQLLDTVVRATPDSHIDLVLGEQFLRLPWNHSRARIVARYHGERIAVGVRAEALTPVAPDTPGDVLSGTVRHLEHHGHETLAFVDVGATSTSSESAEPVPAGSGRTGALGRFLTRMTGQGGAVVPDGRNAHGRHLRKPADVPVRLAPYPGIGPGEPMAVAVDVEALHFFDARRGHRIDVSWRG
ncbi:MAG: ABC transporter ATP-binding protein [Actinomycetota bacterium]